MVEKKNKINNIGTISGTALIITLLLCTVWFFTAEVEIKTDFSCDMDEVNLDIEAYNNIQNYSCRKTNYTAYDAWIGNQNLSCFREDMLLEHIKLKGLDGLNCKGSVDVKSPYIFAEKFMIE